MTVKHFDHLRVYGFKPTPDELTAWWASYPQLVAMAQFELNPRLDNRVETYQNAKKEFLLTLRKKHALCLK